MTDDELASELKHTWGSIDSLLAGLSDDEWNQPTACPGWTVRDQVSHLIGFESQWFLGRKAAPVDASSYDYVQNHLGAENEAWINERSFRAPNDMRAEYSEVVAARLVQLNAARYYPNGFATVITSFRGDETMRDVLALRLFDIWTHEQDIRRALNRPGNLDGPAMHHAVDRMLSSLPWVAAKRAMLPDGTVVAVSLYGARQHTTILKVEDGKGRVASGAEDRPTAAVTMHEESFLLVTAGRVHPADLIADNKISLRGDVAVAEAMALALRVVLL